MPWRRVIQPLLVTSIGQCVDAGVFRGAGLRAFRLLLSNVIAPGSQRLHDLGQDSCGQWNPDEYEGLVNEVGKAQLCPDGYMLSVE